MATFQSTTESQGRDKYSCAPVLAFSCLWYCSWPSQRSIVLCIWSLPLCMLPSPSSSWISCCLALPLLSWPFSWSCKNFLGFHLHLLRSAGKWAGGNASICFLGPSVRLLCSALWEKNGHQTQRTHVMFSQKLSHPSQLWHSKKNQFSLSLSGRTQTTPQFSPKERTQ